MRSSTGLLLALAATPILGALWVLGVAEGPAALETPTLRGVTAGLEETALLARLEASRRSAEEPLRFEIATPAADAALDAAPSAGASDLALLVLAPDGPRPELRLELWRDEGPPAPPGEPVVEQLIALGVDSTDARGWISWSELPYGRYLICLPPAPGQRGYRGPGVTGRRLFELEHRADLLAERVLELAP